MKETIRVNGIYRFLPCLLSLWSGFHGYSSTLQVCWNIETTHLFEMKQTIYVNHNVAAKRKIARKSTSILRIVFLFLIVLFFYGGLCLAIFFVFSLFCRGGYYALTQCFNVHSKFSFKVFEFLGKQDEKYIPFPRSRSIEACFQNLYFQ